MDILALGLILLQLQLASVDGIVTRPGGSEPLGRAKVTLAPLPPGPGVVRRSALTEDNGRFTFSDLLPGNYRLLVESTRYGTVTYGQRRPNGPGSILSLSSGERISDLRVSMMATGVIAGQVTERNGEPAVKAAIFALRYAYQNGKRVLRPVQTTSTNDRGEYRLFWLPPGQYIVGARLNDSSIETGPPRPAMFVQPDGTFSLALGGGPGPFIDVFQEGTVVNRVLENGTVQEESWVPAYYPSVTEARLSIPVDLAPDTVVSGVNISIGPSGVQRIRGILAGGAPASATTQVMLLQKESLLGIPSVRTVAGASFEFSGVLPGAYYLFAADFRADLVSSPIPVEVGNTDVDGLRIPLNSGTQIGVTVMLDNSSENPAARQPVAGIGIRLVPDIAGLPVANTNGQTNALGQAAIRNVPAGNYRIQVLPPSNFPGEPKSFHLKSARLGGRDAGEGLLITEQTTANLEIVVTNDSGSLDGVVTRAGQTASEEATAVLVPDRGRNRTELYKVAVSDRLGRFRFEDIPPGDYKVFAWEDVEPGAWEDPDFLSRYTAQAQAVHITGSTAQSIQVTLIQRP